MTGKVNPDVKVDLSGTVDLKNKSLLVVGGTNGLGRAIVMEAIEKGCTKVTVVGRSFKDDPEKVQFMQADLSLMKEAKRVGETVEPADVVVLTCGIVPKATKEVSGDGIEMDMAVSYLSRLVILKYLVPRLSKGSRVFIMGFPGSNQKNFNVDDLNAEKSYKGGFGFVHMNTVAGNEALVLDYASKTKDVVFFGLNPGMIKTGIRDNMYNSGFMKYVGPVIEGVIGIFAQSPASYAKAIVPLLFANNKLDEQSGAIFNPKPQVVFHSVHFDEDKELVQKFIERSEALVKEKAGIAL
jgi:NAD(P)-dependent dehydrogenase (short-subunit alcohol dehydrogenase family)